MENIKQQRARPLSSEESKNEIMIMLLFFFLQVIVWEQSEIISRYFMVVPFSVSKHYRNTIKWHRKPEFIQY